MHTNPADSPKPSTSNEVVSPDTIKLYPKAPPRQYEKKGERTKKHSKRNLKLPNLKKENDQQDKSFFRRL